MQLREPGFCLIPDIFVFHGQPPDESITVAIRTPPVDAVLPPHARVAAPPGESFTPLGQHGRFSGEREPRRVAGSGQTTPGNGQATFGGTSCGTVSYCSTGPICGVPNTSPSSASMAKRIPSALCGHTQLCQSMRGLEGSLEGQTMTCS